MQNESHPKLAQTDHDVIDLIRVRWSPRSFDATHPIAAPDLRSLFEAARWAPSSGNEQPWRFVFTDARRTPGPHEALLQAVTPKNRAWARLAPMLVLVAVRSSFERNGAPNTHAFYDAGQAVAFFTLQATASGLGVRQMQGFDPERAREACGVPDGYEPAVVMAVGRPGHPDALEFESHREAERQPRQRRPISETVFQGVWGRTFDT